MKKLHLICNAHLDPIWQWTWDEGISAAIATFKSAADLCDEFDYIFCHGESLLYEATEKYAPDLFVRIQKHVKSGKWKIIGGTYLQPDVLMPSGETLVRQISAGQAYFKEKFNTTPTVAANFDSFGHSVGLVQILKKNGYVGYLICRPRGGDQFKYPSRFFEWIGPDGSKITTSETFSYNSPLGKAAEKIKECAAGKPVGMLGSEPVAITSNGVEEDVDYILWGVGNHGGGPSRADLSDIAKLKIEGTEIIHSTPEALFADDIRIGGVVNTSLVTCMPGCYSSMARVKQGFRKAENLFYATEKMLSAASLAGLKVDYSELKAAEKKLLLTTFHDTLPGTVVEEGEREAMGLISAADKALRDYRTHAFLYLTMNERAAGEGEFPIFVFNYQPRTEKSLVEVEFSLADQNWSEEYHLTPRIFDESGRELPCQLIKEESTLNLDWRKKIVFEAELLPLGVTRFTVKVFKTPIKKKKALPVSDISTAISSQKLLYAPVTLELYDDTADPWGMSARELSGMGTSPVDFSLMTEEEAQRFCAVNAPLPPVRIVEDGDIYTAVEALYKCENSRAVLEYKLYKNQPFIDIKLRLEFCDKNKLARIKIPVPNGLFGDAVGDGPYVWEKKPEHGELTFQKWLGTSCDNRKIFAVINDGVYAGKVEDGYIYLTLVRGAGYCFHPIGDLELYPQDRYLPRIDAGKYTYNLRIMCGTASEITRQADSFNQPPYAVNVFPTGKAGCHEYPRISVDGDVVVPVIKETEGGYVIRVYNPDDKENAFKVGIGDDSVDAVASAREVVSVMYKNGSFDVSHTSMPV